MSEKFKGELRFTENETTNRLELLVPRGFTHAQLSKINLADLISRFRPSGCGTCLSGQDFNIRERFEQVIAVNIGEAQIAAE